MSTGPEPNPDFTDLLRVRLAELRAVDIRPYDLEDHVRSLVPRDSPLRDLSYEALREYRPRTPRWRRLLRRLTHRRSPR